MTLPAAAALLLECFFAPPADGSIPAGAVQRARAAVPAEVAASMVERRPLANTRSFEGEPAGVAEWVIAAGRDPAATDFNAVRVSLSTDASLPSPYAARLGVVHVSADRRSSRFEQRMTGWCRLVPAESSPQ